MSEAKNNSTNRRKFLGAAAIGTAAGVSLPKQWIKPIVESVVLPTHATTSESEVFAAFSGTRTFTGPDSSSVFYEDEYKGIVDNSTGFARTIADALVPPAHALHTSTAFWEGSIERIGEKTWKVKVTRRHVKTEPVDCVTEMYWGFVKTVSENGVSQWGSGGTGPASHLPDKNCGFVPNINRHRIGVAIKCLSDPNNPVLGDSGCEGEESFIQVNSRNHEELFRIPLQSTGANVVFGNCGSGTPCIDPEAESEPRSRA